jgi:hypothetical protein
MSVEASGRKFLDALASKIATLYTFEWGIGNRNDYPSIGDVFYAQENDKWEHNYRLLTSGERELEDSTGFHLDRPLTKVKMCGVPLPDLFATEEWESLKRLNRKINNKLHDAILARTRSGRAYLVLPHEDFSHDTVLSFKTIAVKGHLLKPNEILEIKDQDTLF